MTKQTLEQKSREALEKTIMDLLKRMDEIMEEGKKEEATDAHRS